MTAQPTTAAQPQVTAQPMTDQALQTVLITGASGLIGSRLCAALDEVGCLVDFDVKPPDARDSAVEFVETDLTDDDSVRRSLDAVMQRHGPRLLSVIHLAAYYDFSGEPSPLYHDLTVEGTRRLLRGLRETGFTVEQFVFSSSLLVMEPDEQGRHISEFSPTRASWAYPRSKLEAEQVIREERGEIPAVILRIAGVYDEQCHSLPIAQQIARIYERQLESHVFPGDQSHGQALVHLDDLVACFQKTLARRDSLRGEQMFLIAEPDVMSYGELQSRLGELIHGEEWTTIRIPKAVAKAGAWVQEKLADEEHKPFIRPWMIDLADDHYSANVSHAIATLGWEPRHRLRETLPAMTAFLKRDPLGFYETNGLPVPQEIANP